MIDCHKKIIPNPEINANDNHSRLYLTADESGA